MLEQDHCWFTDRAKSDIKVRHSPQGPCVCSMLYPSLSNTFTLLFVILSLLLIKHLLQRKHLRGALFPVYVQLVGVLYL